MTRAATESAYAFDPAPYEEELIAILSEVAEAERLDNQTYGRILRRHPKDGRGFFSKAEILRGLHHLREGGLLQSVPSEELVAKLRRKPVRTQSGVAPLTVLTKPYPCPGRCIFCPSDVRMPKSYLSDEPGAQRAAEHQFDPYRQTLSRLVSFRNTGHDVDKIELIVLGGTWSYYPESYQIWFIKRCFDAFNDFAAGIDQLPSWGDHLDFRELEERVSGASLERRYNRVVEDFVASQLLAPDMAASESATWAALEAVQLQNERLSVRCVGLVVETRPDRIDELEVRRIRRLGATKVQIGYQSLNDDVLRLNKRGHSVAATRRAMRLLRQAGFKIHAHWMPNLHGSSPEQDKQDFARLFEDHDFRPDELKIYPCSLIESAELMAHYRAGTWHPYTRDQLLDVLTECLSRVPPYCRVTRVIRDIPGTDIVAGNKTTNFRQVAELEMDRAGLERRDIRSREIGGEAVTVSELRLDELRYQVSNGTEVFLQYVTEAGRIAGFARLQLPSEHSFLDELGPGAILREVHVYGTLVGLGGRGAGRAQHVGLGRRLVERAASIAQGEGFRSLAVISSVGTREYYRRLGFVDGELYQHRRLGARPRGEVGDRENATRRECYSAFPEPAPGISG